jgi:hypothetical protein
LKQFSFNTPADARSNNNSPEPRDAIPPPASYIKIVPHHHSLQRESRVIPLDGTAQAESNATAKMTYAPKPLNKPWAPFRTRADFEYTETAVQGLLPKHLVDRQLSGIHGSWSKDGSQLTIRSWADMQRSLDAARQYSVQVRVTCHGVCR